MTHDNDPDDDDSRQRANLVAIGIVVLLVVGSIWLIKADMASRDQMDCFLAGRHHCGPAIPDQ
jgi:heme/copper-type cytochrome/quinol oxidase subunit 4